jgi:hypothetical protein
LGQAFHPELWRCGRLERIEEKEEKKEGSDKGTAKGEQGSANLELASSKLPGLPTDAHIHRLLDESDTGNEGRRR